MRIILYTGKGGVGKTSVAAATALRSADLGYKTIVVSTDVAHSLGDSFDLTLGGEPVPVADNLWGQEVDVLRELDVYWKTVRDWLSAVMRWQGADEVVADEVAILPGMVELVGLLYINRYADQAAYDVVIVDCAPTGETLRLLSFPEMARWYMRRLFPIERRVAAAVRPLVRGVMRVPLPGGDVFDTIQELFHQLEKMRSLLSDGALSSVRLVVNAEKMVVKETQRTFTYLNLYGYNTDLVVCNRLLPDAVGDGFFGSWKASQARYFQLIEESFASVPILRAPLLDREVVGLPTLRELAQGIFGDDDPTRVYHRGRSQEVAKEGSTYVLTLSLPFTTTDDISVTQNRDELIVQAASHRRNILLPASLAGLQVMEANKEGGTLKVRFRDPKAMAEPRKRRGRP
ncbi:MAG: ArsA family ATPase [Chloroflexi bacterium]|nr:ArsA family ATPase [Chloroflexota bacterium]